MKDKQARKAIKSLRDAVNRLGHRVGVEVIYWPESGNYHVLKEGWFLQELRELKECIEKVNILADVLGFEFEHQPKKLIAKKKSEK